MKVFNKGRRTFNNNTEHAVRPGIWTEVPDQMAQDLLRDYPREITTNSAAVTIVNPQLEAENKALKEKNAALELRLANMEKLISGGRGSDAPVNDLVGETTAGDPVAPQTVLPTPSPTPPTPPPPAPIAAAQKGAKPVQGRR